MKKITLAVLLTLPSIIAFADAIPFSLPTDNKLIEFVYDKNQTYTILAQDLKPTDIEVGSDEVIVGKAVGDDVLWKIEIAGDRHIFIKPLQPNIDTAMTLITNKRAYQMTLKSGPTGGKWNQHVSWSYPDVEKFIQLKKVEEDTRAQKEQDRLDNQIVSTSVDVDSMNSNYEITGTDDIKPIMVMDDGKRTWIKLKQTQVVPAIYIDNGNKNYALVDYDGPKNGYVILQRVTKKIIMKIGKSEVTITNKNYK